MPCQSAEEIEIENKFVQIYRMGLNFYHTCLVVEINIFCFLFDFSYVYSFSKKTGCPFFLNLLTFI